MSRQPSSRGDRWYQTIHSPQDRRRTPVAFLREADCGKRTAGSGQPAARSCEIAIVLQMIFSHDEPVRGVIGNVGALKFNGLEGSRRFIKGDLAPPPIHHLIGTRPTSVGPGTVTWSMPVTPWLMSDLGIIFGGVFALFADAPLGGALYSNVAPGQFVTTTELSISYVRPATLDSGSFTGRANTVHAGRNTGISAVHVEDRFGRLLAHGTTRCVITDMPFDPDADLIPAADPILDPPDPYLRPIEIPKPNLIELTKRTPLEAMQAYVDGDMQFGPVGILAGARAASVSDGEYEAQMPASPWFSAGMPTMYGGVIAWAMDSVMNGAIYSSLEPGAVNANMDMKVRFLRPAFLDMSLLTIRSEVVHRGRTVRTARAEMTDANGKRIALATASAMIVPNAAAELATGRAIDDILLET